ncbi:MAG: hypothetical protein RDV48_19750 [Candidatus Eremiobacteraeota bacterium]|nr:hypothetical protein [Candidatus Eremiobacteraeota bacterium]
MNYRYLKWDEEELKRLMHLMGLMSLFNELLLVTNGDVEEAFRILELLQARGIIGNSLNLEEFRSEIERKKIVYRDNEGISHLSKSGEKKLREHFLHEIFNTLKRDGPGDHLTEHLGTGCEMLPELVPYQFGDSLDRIAIKESLQMAMRRGIDEISITEKDLMVHETAFNASCATVIMLDISHSMILYGEDRITPAKKVALALAELVLKNYSHDSLHCVLFGDTAWEVKLEDLPYAGVGPYHTNTRAGLELAQKILLGTHQANRQIFMITDGKPSCITKGGCLYKNAWGLDPEIVNKTLNEAGNCRKNGIAIITFMIARDALLVDFIERLTRINRGRAYYTSPSRLGEYLLSDYLRNRKKRIR